MLNPSVFEREKRLLQQSAADHLIPGGAVSIILPKESIEFYFGNKALLPEELPVTEDTMDDLASLTKVVATTTAALQCLEEGYFTLQTEVNKIIPEFPYKGITIENLMTHTSGICGDDKKYKACSSKEELIDFFMKKELVFEPGTMEGNILGPFVYLIPNVLLAWGTRWFFLVKAYEMGTALVAKIHSSDIFSKFVNGATAVGLMVIAGITCTTVNINFNVEWDAAGTVLSLQGIFDKILLNLPEMLCLALFCWIIKKNSKGVYWCLIGTFVVGILGVLVGLF